MGKPRSNQAGFGTVGSLLILVIAGIVGFTGWYVYMLSRKQIKASHPLAT